MADVPVITIDGPSGSGKGTLAARLAEALGWHLLDSGALYRIVAFSALERQLPLDDADALAAMARALVIRFAGDRVEVDGADATERLRTEGVGEAASRVAALQPVRDAVLDVQRDQRRPPGLVADGRDMGTVVFRDAGLKVFLDADVEERAERRFLQLLGRGQQVTREAVLQALKERDRRDRERTVAPLRPAEDAVVIDSTDLPIDAVLALVLRAAERAGLADSSGLPGGAT